MNTTNSTGRWNLVLAAVCIGTTAAAYFVSTGLHTLWQFAWIAPIPILVLAFKSSARLSAASAFLAYLLGSLNMASYLATIVPIGVVIVVLMVPAVFFALSVLCARFADAKLPCWAGTLAFPAAWTSYEYLLSIVSPHGTFGSLAYSQTDFLLLIQIASIAGIWGITFVLTLVPSGIAAFWHHRQQSTHAFASLAIALSVGILSLAYGWTRLAEPNLSPPLRAGLAATDTTIRFFQTERREEALPVVEAYAQRIGELAAHGAQAVVLPEKFVGVTPGYVDDVYRILGDAARAGNVMVVAGLNRIGVPVLRNTAVVFSPEGRVLLDYDKAYPVPGIEVGYIAGTRQGFIPAFQPPAGVAICKDMDFPVWTRQYEGVGILFVPAWDFVRDARLHSRMAVLRGVEGGFAVVRAAQKGLLTVSDSHGRILAEDTSARIPDALLIADVAPGRGHTFYSRFGDWVGWVGILLLFSISSFSVARRSWNK
jgi:apolipoprotein N-acyltransferase